MRETADETAEVVIGGAALLDPAAVGYKFARLEQMRRAEFPVPGFFCLGADQFDLTMDRLSPDLAPRPSSADIAAVEAWCAAAARALAAAPVSEESAALLFEAFDALIGPEELAAVRACAVKSGPRSAADDGDEAVEDGAADPFAGMSESFLYVPRERVLEAVSGCWASAFAPQAVRYRLHKGLDPSAVRIAVGVQRMVRGTRSFVAFTRDPRDATARRIVVAAAHGIGEGVVQEKADVDHLFVEGAGANRRVRAQTVVKRWMVTEPERRGGRPALVPVPAELADVPVLDDALTLRIAALAEAVEELFGCPQDIEGAVTADGEVHLVQARPMVVAAPARTGPVTHWGNHNITESFPGVSSALTYSQARIFYQLIFTDLYRRMGVRPAQLRENAHRLTRMIGHLHGRIYYRLDDWQVLHGQMPAFDLIRPQWEQGMGITGEVSSGPRWSHARTAAALPAVAWRACRHRRESKQLLRWWDALMLEVYGTEKRNAEELIALYRRIWDEVSRRWGVTLANSIYGMFTLRFGVSLLRRWADAGPEALPGLLAGGPENRTLAAARSAMALAEEVSALPDLREAMLRAHSEDQLRALWTDLKNGLYGIDIARGVEAYLRRYGDRALHDLKLEEPTPRQSPWILLGMLRPMVRVGQTAEKSRSTEAEAAAQARSKLRETCRNPLRRAVLNTVLSLMRWCVRAREDTRFCRTQLFGISREVMWRLGAELADNGLLDDAGQVVDLTVEEVLGAFDGTLPGTGLRALARLRAAEREYHRTLPDLPALMAVPEGRPIAIGLPLAAPAGGTTDTVQHAPGALGVLRGLGSSGGIVRGRAKIVLDPAVSPDDCRGKILIARETDPGWLYLMLAASGLVVERGTLLSHTAITGRLLGVPTAVAVPGATSAIPDGAWIELDGDSGTVTILDEEPKS